MVLNRMPKRCVPSSPRKRRRGWLVIRRSIRSLVATIVLVFYFSISFDLGRRYYCKQRTSIYTESAIAEAASLEVFTRSDMNHPTIALGIPLVWGLRNECQALMCFVMRAMEQNVTQLLLESLSFQDTHGTLGRVPFERLFDVEHWNSHYPALPRIVRYNPLLHPQWNFSGAQSKDTAHATKPYFMSLHTLELLRCYGDYVRSLEVSNSTERNPAELLIIKGALRPHRDIQKVIDRHVTKIENGSKDYMTVCQVFASHFYEAMLLHKNDNPLTFCSSTQLHARVEPDMQFHVYCPDQKVRNLTEIFDMIEKQFPVPPADKMFISINRKQLEENGGMDPYYGENQLAVENLKALNKAVAKGLWGGKVTVFDKEPPTPETAGVIGAIIAYFISLQSSLFIGTEVSSFSMDVITTRFYRGIKSNYLYQPDGLVLATPESADRPPRFQC
jgi:hypothetical protein